MEVVDVDNDTNHEDQSTKKEAELTENMEVEKEGDETIQGGENEIEGEKEVTKVVSKKEEIKEETSQEESSENKNEKTFFKSEEKIVDDGNTEVTTVDITQEADAEIIETTESLIVNTFEEIITNAENSTYEELFYEKEVSNKQIQEIGFNGCSEQSITFSENKTESGMHAQCYNGLNNDEEIKEDHEEHLDKNEEDESSATPDLLKACNEIDSKVKLIRLLVVEWIIVYV